MKITPDVRYYATAPNIEAEKALAVGMSEKSKEFVAREVRSTMAACQTVLRASLNCF
jgi:hypothetical protein